MTKSEQADILKETGMVRVDQIREGVDLALYLKDIGQYDLFRGQRNAEWRLTSTAERLGTSPETTARVQAEFLRFYNWSTGIPEMHRYLKDKDALWAIAQHYGLPTAYIDFTSDPRMAAFFASDSIEKPTSRQEAVVYCLDSKGFNAFWRDSLATAWMRSEGIEPPELIQLDVDNLWRLQVQSGSFLWMPIEDFETHWSIDRIVFPAVQDDPCLPRREHTYPNNQSQLELLLTQYFMDEQMREGNTTGRKLWQAEQWHTLETPEDYYEGVEWVKSTLPISDGWEQKDSWLYTGTERATQTIPGREITIVGNDLSQVVLEVCECLSQKAGSFDRTHGITFARSLNGDIHIERFLAATRRLWNGMRGLPYTNSEIVASLIVLGNLFNSSFYFDRDPSQAPQSFGSRSEYVEFGATYDGRGAYSRGHVSADGMIEAFSSTFVEAATSSYPGLNDPDKLSRLIQLPCRPWHRFTFNGLRKLLVEELIPTQLVYRGATEGDEGLRTWIAFSPAELKTFGLP